MGRSETGQVTHQEQGHAQACMPQVLAWHGSIEMLEHATRVNSTCAQHPLSRRVSTAPTHPYRVIPFGLINVKYVHIQGDVGSALLLHGLHEATGTEQEVSASAACDAAVIGHHTACGKEGGTVMVCTMSLLFGLCLLVSRPQARAWGGALPASSPFPTLVVCSRSLEVSATGQCQATHHSGQTSWCRKQHSSGPSLLP